MSNGTCFPFAAHFAALCAQAELGNVSARTAAGHRGDVWSQSGLQQPGPGAFPPAERSSFISWGGADRFTVNAVKFIKTCEVSDFQETCNVSLEICC